MTKAQALLLPMAALLCTTLAAGTTLRTLPGFTAAGKAMIVPEPIKQQFTDGVCKLPEKLTVSVPAGAESEFEHLADALKRFAGVTAVKGGKNAFCKLEITKKGTPKNREGYTLDVTADGIRIAGHSRAGLYYGIMSLKSLLRSNPGQEVPCCKIFDAPVLQERGVFINCRNLSKDKIPAFKNIMRAMADIKINSLVLEFADNFPFENNPFTKRKFALTKEELLDIADFARKHHIDIIPHLQCWSHVAWLSTHPEFESMREGHEKHGWAIAYCPNNELAVGLTLRAIRESIALLKPKYFHLCLDELEWAEVAVCPKCKGNTPAELITKHTKMLQDEVLKLGVKPIVYHDTYYPGRSFMGEKALPHLDKSMGIMVWNYHRNLDPTNFKYFDKLGFDVWGAGRGQYPDNPMNMARTLTKLKNPRGSILTYWYDHVHSDLLGEKYISHRAYIGTVLQANYTWNPAAAPWKDLNYDPIYLSRLLVYEKEYTPIAKTDKVTPIPIYNRFNHRFGDDKDFPQIKDASGLKKMLAATPEKFDLVTAPEGGFYGIMLSSTKGISPGVVNIPVKPFKAKRLTYLITTGRSEREMYYELTSGSRHYPRVSSVKVIFTDKTSQELPLYYNFDITNWNNPIGAYKMRIVSTGGDDNGNVFSLGAVTHDIDPNKTIRSISFYSNRKEGVRPVLLAISAVNATGAKQAVSIDTKKISQRIAANPLPGTKPEVVKDFHYIDFKDGTTKNAKIYGFGLQKKISYKVVKLEDGRSAVKIHVPPKKNMSSLARVIIDLDIPKDTVGDLKSMKFDFRIKNAFGIQRTDCYITNEKVDKWKAKHTFHTIGSEEWQHFQFPLHMMEQRRGKVAESEYHMMRISFWMHNPKPVTIWVTDIGGSTSTKIDAPLNKAE